MINYVSYMDETGHADDSALHFAGMAGFIAPGFRMRYSKTPSGATNGFKLYICTFWPRAVCASACCVGVDKRKAATFVLSDAHTRSSLERLRFSGLADASSRAGC